MGRSALSQNETCRYLVSDGDQGPEKWYALGPTPLTIGREQSRDIVLADTNVSRLHAQVCVVNDQVIVTDLVSTNGTFIAGRRLTVPTKMRTGDVLQMGGKRLRYETRSRRDVEREQELHRDLEKASSYVLSLLPPRATEGCVRADWFFHPSARLGGDAFGYEWLDPETFVTYIVDVSGHGIGAAMHSVSVLNVLRRRALPHTDLRRPDEVLASLNAMFQMDNHNDMFFTMWYGVYVVSSQTLTYASAGHHPGYLVSPERAAATPLKTRGPMIGASTASRFDSNRVVVAANSSLYLFSDGVFEITTKTGEQFRLRDFVPHLLERATTDVAEPERLYQVIKGVSGGSGLDDDVSLLTLTFA